MRYFGVNLPKELRNLRVKEVIVVSDISRALLVFEEKQRKKRKR